MYVFLYMHGTFMSVLTHRIPTFFLLEVLRWEIGVDLYLLLVHCDVDALCLEPGPHRQVRPTCC